MVTQTDISEEIRLLRDLLNKSHLERKHLATIIHKQKGDLILVNFALHHIETDAKAKKKLNLQNIEDIKTMLSKYLSDLREITADISKKSNKYFVRKYPA